MKNQDARRDTAPVLKKKRCGTCIDRKISCDRRYPQCSSCVRSNRACQGYGLRLSWPRDDDRKRLIISRNQSPMKNGRRNDFSSGSFHMINATTWDIEIHHHLASPHGALPALRYSLSWSVSGLSATERDLFQFFEQKIAFKLSSFSNQPLGQTLLRLASLDGSAASVALRRALMAVSSQYRYGSGLRAEELKLSAIHALSASAAGGIQSQSAVQHVAAGMVLCMFETQKSSSSSNQWLCYLYSAWRVIEGVSLETFGRVAEGPIMLEWAYYHEVMARFSLRHWRYPEIVMPGRPVCPSESKTYLPGDGDWWYTATGIIQWQRPMEHQQMFEPLHLLSEVAAEVLPSTDPASHTEKYKGRIAQLKRRARDLEVPTPSDPRIQRAAAKAEVFRASTLVYLSRATNSDLIRPSELCLLVDRSLSLMQHMSPCERPLPLLILGCEARTDVERLRVLDLVSSTENTPPDRELHYIRILLHALWTQDDLHAEDNVEPDYMEKLSVVFSASSLLPHFG
ncbi:hypothetical protein CH063_00776 [Colletotrichum higginsianum]|uniref:Zinc-finger transcription factor n=2 Tax=Colletotrichum destructivum species complex TaxID=2707350 RepID=H1UWA1_COLHI|nr:Zinc-finger transcription factor [Colletotrichum higginsianum IMI 349063]OBR09893.1 Zinc-finger transcription factor [Colletotrichum higginsianum IMI 349063]CCF32252.1 hypothetical protein CH063_00776 [Colletotrichum higginsianum]